MRLTGLAATLLLVAGACSQVTVETSSLSGGTLVPAAENPSTIALEAAADAVCTDKAWVGIAEPGSFADEADALGVTPGLMSAAVRRRCPGTFYKQLSDAEVGWCGDGLHFGSNLLLVVEAGIDLGIESFSIVEPGLVAKASKASGDLTDYEIELLTAELQTMIESSRFERDWAQACRSTL